MAPPDNHIPEATTVDTPQAGQEWPVKTINGVDYINATGTSIESGTAAKFVFARFYGTNSTDATPPPFTPMVIPANDGAWSYTNFQLPGDAGATSIAEGGDLYLRTWSYYQGATGFEIPGNRVFVRQHARIAHWKLDDGEGDEAADSSGNNHSGILQNSPTWSAEKPTTRVEGSLRFDGVNQYVSVADNSNFNLGFNDFTICVWAKFDGNQNGVFLGHAEPGANATKWFFGRYSGRIQFHVKTSVSGPFNFFNYDWTYNGGWRLWSVVKSGTGFTLYLNGAAVIPTEHQELALFDPDDVLTIGYAKVFDFFKGWLCDVRIYPRALLPSEIQSIFDEET